jgi:transcriptional regulator with XRE-family HTH domain
MSKHKDLAPAAGQEDELESYVTERLRDPAFRAAYEDAQERHRIIDTLLRLRRHQRLSQSAVAESMGVRQPTVSGFETEDSDPRLSTLQRYARAVGARLRLSAVVSPKSDWIAAGANAYSRTHPQAPIQAAVRESELAEEWKAEKQQGSGRRWAKSA